MRYKTTWKLTGVEPFQATLPLDQRREEVDGGEEEEVGHGEACVWRVTGGGGGGRGGGGCGDVGGGRQTP